MVARFARSVSATEKRASRARSSRMATGRSPSSRFASVASSTAFARRAPDDMLGPVATDLTEVIDGAMDAHAALRLFGTERAPDDWTYTTYAELRALAARYERSLASRGVSGG